MMAQILGFCSSWGYKTQKENLKVACANLPIGRAADLGVINPQTFHQITVVNSLLILPCVLDTNADDLPFFG